MNGMILKKKEERSGGRKGIKGMILSRRGVGLWLWVRFFFFFFFFGGGGGRREREGER